MLESNPRKLTALGGVVVQWKNLVNTELSRRDSKDYGTAETRARSLQEVFSIKLARLICSLRRCMLFPLAPILTVGPERLNPSLRNFDLARAASIRIAIRRRSNLHAYLISASVEYTGVL